MFNFIKKSNSKLLASTKAKKVGQAVDLSELRGVSGAGQAFQFANCRAQGLR